MTAADLLGEVLPGVSRSFALSLRILPPSLRGPLGITYLLARAADTIADTHALPPTERRDQLQALRAAIESGQGSAVRVVAARVAADLAPAERTLLERLPDVVAAYHDLLAGDRARAQTVLLTLTQAMLDALARFPSQTDGRVEALETPADLDRYTYMNAGCVGEFWTDMAMAHRPRCAGWDRPLMRARAARFGQGLQLVNVLRDLPRDLRIGRCYLPRVDLAAVGLTPAGLLAPEAISRLRPLITALVDLALAHLGEALAYTLDVPRREARLRLACAWPLLIALATLRRLRGGANLLDPAVLVKIPRVELRTHLAVSTALVTSNLGLRAYVHRLAARAGGAGPPSG